MLDLYSRVPQQALPWECGTEGEGFRDKQACRGETGR